MMARLKGCCRTAEGIHTHVHRHQYACGISRFPHGESMLASNMDLINGEMEQNEVCPKSHILYGLRVPTSIKHLFLLV